MASSGLEVFDETVQKTDIWLKELMADLRLDSRQRAYEALRGVLHAVRDQMPLDEVAHFASEMPMLVRGFFYEGWNPRLWPDKDRNRNEFLQRIAREVPYNTGEADLVRIAQGVLAMIRRHISEGEYEEVKRTLPRAVRDIWPLAGAERRGGAIDERRAA